MIEGDLRLQLERRHVLQTVSNSNNLFQTKRLPWEEGMPLLQRRCCDGSLSRSVFFFFFIFREPLPSRSPLPLSLSLSLACAAACCWGLLAKQKSCQARIPHSQIMCTAESSPDTTKILRCDSAQTQLYPDTTWKSSRKTSRILWRQAATRSNGADEQNPEILSCEGTACRFTEPSWHPTSTNSRHLLSDFRPSTHAMAQVRTLCISRFLDTKSHFAVDNCSGANDCHENCALRDCQHSLSM